MNASTSRLSPIIVALDVDTQADALKSVERLATGVDIFKIGLQLFSREGIAVVAAVIARGKGVFVDLKLHDIPNTVAQAVRVLAMPGVEFLTVHASGGGDMLLAASTSLKQVRQKNPAITTKLLAVTVLTSMDEDDLRDIGVDHSVAGQVLNLARLARANGIDGVVASPQEVALLRAEHGNDLVIVTPGVRQATAEVQDQKRVMTPSQAMKEGSDFLVMGRSLLEAESPELALKAVLAEIGAIAS